MRREAMCMGAGRLALALLVALAAVAAPIARTARAESASDPESERWWGAAGAVLCGAEIRLVRLAPAIGMNPYALAAGIAGCALAMLDVMTTE